jgi:uncharacterized membrane protein
MNPWLFVVVQAVTSVIITFALIVVMLVMGMATGMNFIWCFVIGTVLSLPPAWFITKRMTKDY